MTQENAYETQEIDIAEIFGSAGPTISRETLDKFSRLLPKIALDFFTRQSIIPEKACIEELNTSFLQFIDGIDAPLFPDIGKISLKVVPSEILCDPAEFPGEIINGFGFIYQQKISTIQIEHSARRLILEGHLDISIPRDKVTIINTLPS